MRRAAVRTSFVTAWLSTAFLACSLWAAEQGVEQRAEQRAEQSVARIVALSPSSTEMLFDIGVGERIVGTVDYADFPEAAKVIPRIGNYAGLNIEAIVALQPDLVVAWKSGNKQSDLSKLESLGLPVLYVDPKSMAEVRNELARLGRVVGEPELGKAASERFSREYERLLTEYRTKAPVRVFYQLSYEPLRTVGNGSWVGSLIGDCGGVNIFAEADSPYPVVALESVIVRDPEVIVMSSHTNATESKEALWAEWPSVSAVQNDAMIPVNSSALLRSGPRATEGLALLCEAIDRVRPD